MNRPHVICHMMTSLDGKIDGDYMNTEEAQSLYLKYVEIQESYNPKAWMCGRVTMEGNFAFGEKVEFKGGITLSVPRTDFIADSHAERYVIAVDPKGKLRWTQNTIPTSFQLKVESHIVVVITEDVADEYLTYLRDLGISYIFGGKEQLDLHEVLRKIHTLLGAQEMMLDGGAYLNGTFLNEGLVDELSLLITPTADGDTSTQALFAKPDSLVKQPAARFILREVQKLESNGIYLNYTINR
ncbi:RibD family protein [Paenibacillus sp. GCM10012306]|uniref:RibD family protein n=1 Tax=Paenibacillus sp. GCM10012306 TaxID=3317342 RepID=UPI00360E5BC9